MKIEQWKYTDKWDERPESPNANVQMAFIFASRKLFTENHAPFIDLKEAYPNATLIGCSTAGEIFQTQVLDDSVVVTAVEFEKTTLKFAQFFIDEPEQSQNIGKKIALELDDTHLKHVFVLSEGLVINGSALIKGIAGNIPSGVSITGGLAADGSQFEKTILYKNQPQTKTILAIGFYGQDLTVGCGSFGGWDPFGPLRKITRARGNILYEMDHQPALELYKKYLGEYADGLPSTGLLFPLSLRETKEDGERSLVRTILSVDESKGSLTFAGEMPQGHYVQLMKANFERLIDGAGIAAKNSQTDTLTNEPDLALLISCVGRKMVLKQRVEEEIEEVQAQLNASFLTGFYSYGEISPFQSLGSCSELHNQTMTITTFKET